MNPYKSRMVRGVPFDVRLTENTVTRAEAMRAFDDLRAQVSNLPQPSGEILIDMDDLIFYEVVMEKRNNDAYLVIGNYHSLATQLSIV